MSSSWIDLGSELAPLTLIRDYGGRRKQLRDVLDMQQGTLRNSDTVRVSEMRSSPVSFRILASQGTEGYC